MTSTARPRKASRVMKARWPGTCHLCRGPIVVGQQIAKAPVWAHVQCVIDHAVTLTQANGRGAGICLGAGWPVLPHMGSSRTMVVVL